MIGWLLLVMDYDRTATDSAATVNARLDRLVGKIDLVQTTLAVTATYTPSVTPTPLPTATATLEVLPEACAAVVVLDQTMLREPASQPGAAPHPLALQQRIGVLGTSENNIDYWAYSSYAPLIRGWVNIQRVRVLDRDCLEDLPTYNLQTTPIYR